MATKTTNYGLTKPEGSDFYDIDVHNGNSDIIDAQLKKLYDAKTGHVGNKSNPHSVTKSQIGLGNVENKSSATIREEMTKANVTKALGYTPATQSDMTNAQNAITQLNSERAFLSKVFSGTSNKMIYWQRCQSEIAKALGMQISDINNEKLHIAACNGDWNAYQGLVTGAALQWDNTNLNINIGLSSDTNGVVRINFMIYRKLN